MTSLRLARASNDQERHCTSIDGMVAPEDGLPLPSDGSPALRSVSGVVCSAYCASITEPPVLITENPLPHNLPACSMQTCGNAALQVTKCRISPSGPYTGLAVPQIARSDEHPAIIPNRALTMLPSKDIKQCLMIVLTPSASGFKHLNGGRLHVRVGSTSRSGRLPENETPQRQEDAKIFFKQVSPAAISRRQSA